MQLKKYLVMKGPTGELELWPRTQYEQYIQGCVDFGAGSAYGIITHFDEEDRLLSAPPASAVEEADKLYPPDPENDDWYTDGQVSAMQQQAHITCAGMYTGEIERLKAENSKMRQALKRANGLCMSDAFENRGDILFEIANLTNEALKTP